MLYILINKQKQNTGSRSTIILTHTNCNEGLFNVKQYCDVKDYDDNVKFEYPYNEIIQPGMEYLMIEKNRPLINLICSDFSPRIVKVRKIDVLSFIINDEKVKAKFFILEISSNIIKHDFDVEIRPDILEDAYKPFRPSEVVKKSFIDQKNFCNQKCSFRDISMFIKEWMVKSKYYDYNDVGKRCVISDGMTLDYESDDNEDGDTFEIKINRMNDENDMHNIPNGQNLTFDQIRAMNDIYFEKLLTDNKNEIKNEIKSIDDKLNVKKEKDDIFNDTKDEINTIFDTYVVDYFDPISNYINDGIFGCEKKEQATVLIDTDSYVKKENVIIIKSGKKEDHVTAINYVFRKLKWTKMINILSKFIELFGKTFDDDGIETCRGIDLIQKYAKEKMEPIDGSMILMRKMYKLNELKKAGDLSINSYLTLYATDECIVDGILNRV